MLFSRTMTNVREDMRDNPNIALALRVLPVGVPQCDRFVLERGRGFSA